MLNNLDVCFDQVDLRNIAGSTVASINQQLEGLTTLLRSQPRLDAPTFQSRSIRLGPGSRIKANCANDATITNATRMLASFSGWTIMQ